MPLADRVLQVLGSAVRPMDDDELAERLGVIRQHVNQVCRGLEADGHLRRVQGTRGKIVNEIIQPQRESKTSIGRRGFERPHLEQPDEDVSEDQVKRAVKEHLEKQGLAVRVAWGRERGVDIETSGATRWLIEAKGSARSQPQQVNYFLGALGELVQRMKDPSAAYGLALPDNQQYRNLVMRLPAEARRRLNLYVFFVGRDNDELRVEVSEPPPS